MLIVVRFLTGIVHGTYFGNDRPTIVAFTPKEKMGQGQGFSFMGLALGFLSAWIAPYLTGWMKDATGSFSGGLYMAGFLMGCGVILALSIRLPLRIKARS